jgi:hypothetical protein
MTTIRQILPLLAAGLLAASCGKTASSPLGGGAGGDPGGSATPVTGIALPSEVSALPTTDGGAASARAAPRRLAAAAPAADSDYATVPTRKYVNERSVSQFDILNTIFGAVGQTHYADAENVNQGPYKAMVSWTEEQGKEIIPWVVDSTMIVDQAGKDVNLVKVWMEQVMGDGQVHLIKVSLRVSEPPTQNPDGSYADYGVWRLDAKFAEDPAAGFFVAEAARGGTGESVIKLHQREDEGETRGILHRSADVGYGKVTFPDWETCNDGSCTTPPPATVAYAYTADAVSIEKTPQTGPVVALVKDRTGHVDMVNRYKLFDAATGEDVAKQHTFGFPFRFQVDGHDRWGNYGAWQGRHQIWANGAALAEGAVVSRADVAPGEVAPSYTASKLYAGVLVKRVLEATSIQDIQSLVLGTWLNDWTTLYFDQPSGTFYECRNQTWNQGVRSCDPGTGPGTTVDLSRLVADPTVNRNVNLNTWDQGSQMGYTLVYEDGLFYPATQGMNGQPAQRIPGSQPYAFANDAQVWVSINWQAYVSWTGSGWVQKELIGLDLQTNTPSFGPTDTPFTPEIGRDIYLNDMGTNYVVRRGGGTGEDAGDYAVKVERQNVANPANAVDAQSPFVAAGTLFKRMWNGDTQSTFRFDADPRSATFLKLVYEVPGSQDSAQGKIHGSVLDAGEWSLVATIGGVQQPEAYGWEYPTPDRRPGDTYGTQQFLLLDGQPVMLDDPIRFSPVTLVNGAGESKKYSLQYDGNWVGGLPEIWSDLQATGYQMTEAIARKVVAIPDGTLVTDASDGSKQYLFKAVEVQQFLPVLSSPPAMDLDQAQGLLLGSVPDFQDEHLGDTPDVPVKYSEGQLVQ